MNIRIQITWNLKQRQTRNKTKNNPQKWYETRHKPLLSCWHVVRFSECSLARFALSNDIHSINVHRKAFTNVRAAPMIRSPASNTTRTSCPPSGRRPAPSGPQSAADRSVPALRQPPPRCPPRCRPTSVAAAAAVPVWAPRPGRWRSPAMRPAASCWAPPSRRSRIRRRRRCSGGWPRASAWHRPAARSRVSVGVSCFAGRLCCRSGFRSCAWNDDDRWITTSSCCFFPNFVCIYCMDFV